MILFPTFSIYRFFNCIFFYSYVVSYTFFFPRIIKVLYRTNFSFSFSFPYRKEKYIVYVFTVTVLNKHFDWGFTVCQIPT